MEKKIRLKKSFDNVCVLLIERNKIDFHTKWDLVIRYKSNEIENDQSLREWKMNVIDLFLSQRNISRKPSRADLTFDLVKFELIKDDGNGIREKNILDLFIVFFAS